MGNINKVVSGDYMGYPITDAQNKILIIERTTVNIPLSKRLVESFVEISSDASKSTSSVIKRTLVGSVIAGGVGALAGSMTAKSKITHKVMIKFKDGKSCVAELDDNYYGILVMSLC